MEREKKEEEEEEEGEKENELRRIIKESLYNIMVCFICYHHY